MTAIEAQGDQTSRWQSRVAGHAATAGVDLRRREKTLRQAWRHTVLVRVLRVLLPLGVVGSFGFYGLLLQAKFAVGPGTLQFGKIEVTDDDLKMKNPSYFGVTNDGGKYTVKAHEAAVDLAMTGPIKLEGIVGDLVQASGVTTNLKATRGALDNKQGILDLADGVDITTSDGMIAHLIRAHVMTKEHYVSTRDPMVADMPAGHLTANAMDLWTDKKIGKFFDAITLRLVQQPGAAGPAIGIGGDARQPVEIAAREMAIDDATSLVDFTTTVVARQGETQLTAPFMRATYEGHAVAATGPGPAAGSAANAAAVAATGAGSSTAAGAGAAAGSQLTHIAAYPGVVLTAGTDRRLIAERVDFDVKADTALFAGNVELRQARNVFRGGRLAIDRKAGRTHLDTPATAPKAAAGRVYATLVQTPDPAKPAVQKGKAVATAAGEAPTALGGLNGDPNAPTDIEADTLDVDDATKQAIFRGHVIAKQGDYVIDTAELVAHYSGQTGLMSAPSSAAADAVAAKSRGKPAAPANAGAQLTAIDTKGGTKIVSKDGKDAEGQAAHFDLKTNMVTLDGPDGVVLKQGGNKINGSRLRMNLASGEAHVENSPQSTSVAIAPTAAQLSIAAKPGVAPPAQPTECPPGRMCAILHPDDLQKSQVTGKDGQSVTGQTLVGAIGSGKEKPAKPTAAAPPAAAPQISPSTVYRQN